VVEKLSPGLFIRRPCDAAVLEALWAGVDVKPAAKSTSSAHPASRSLPAWLLDLHELDLKTLCRKCVRGLGLRLGYRDVSLYLYDAEHGLLTLAETTHTRPIDLAVRCDSEDQSLMAAVARGGRMLHTERVGAELAALRIDAHRDRPYTDEGCLIVPLAVGGQLLGVLSFSGRAHTAQTELGLPLDDIFAFVARALEHARAYERARLEARVDSLTGLYNQRWMVEALEKEIRRADRFGTALALLMLDLDGLKAVNDRAGHAAGDCLLRHVAARISAVLRQFDGAARVGGDEFVVTLPATNLQGAQQVARRLLQSIRDDVAHFEGCPLPITASAGAAQWRQGWDARQLIEAADQAMYAAKGEGRNTLVCHPAAAGPQAVPGPAQPPPVVRLGGRGRRAAPATRFTEAPPAPVPAAEELRIAKRE
jgi:diguanylate cyclase (GGDEF)-like protein